MEQQFFRRTEATRYLREAHGAQVAVATLNKLATIGGGPKFRHVGRWPVYARQDLDEWIRARTSGLKASTSDPGSAPAASVSETVEGGDE